MYKNIAVSCVAVVVVGTGRLGICMNSIDSVLLECLELLSQTVGGQGVR